MTFKKSNRLKNYDYSSDGYYFITICTKNHEEWFGHINNSKMCINSFGLIIQKQWYWLEKQFENIILDTFIVMPNHFHGILIIDTCSGNPRIATTKYSEIHKRRHSTLSKTISAFKTTSSCLIHKSGFTEFKWQRSFYDRIIRNDKELFRIRNYIKYNPLKWEKDKENPKNLNK